MRRTPLLLALALAACGPPPSQTAATSAGGEAFGVDENQNGPPPEPYHPPEAHASPPPGVERGAGGLGLPGAGDGRSREAPLPACGPVESYRIVAAYRCPDGSQPLGGDLHAGQRARVGNVGANHTGHIIDLYRVPCPGGDVELYVDMYGCPGGSSGPL